MIGDNLTRFTSVFQCLNLDLNQKQDFLLTMFKWSNYGEKHVANMCIYGRDGY
ncbi:conserved protein of unknown function [Citrobacter amalonaticus]|uniref:Uncharacterized protein n=1 Tax=Citrobacter amalonaticus TaxID=35703 RepID=A0AAX2BJX7_CITAM|nr:conserved protein of unknown function [Citrobacter amalonaticus]SAZ82241.1 conserved protein of unknown function [Citrobacter amalonaticus]